MASTATELSAWYEASATCLLCARAYLLRTTPVLPMHASSLIDRVLVLQLEELRVCYASRMLARLLAEEKLVATMDAEVRVVRAAAGCFASTARVEA